ncbi:MULTISPECIES: UDP-glucose 4-epimerase GalE [Bacillus]|uniref:UDP-glucose 4-epimerase GalE n=1 Tax=Bacillus TaxID=1386 RepID=UPI0003310893|nr:UDP-glucose 4-epimerase GalE [Bacillus wiedmannii]EOP15452.1 UDP-glucose 4-epimerase [Bacillus cereus BAG2O-3]EOQ06237.1 UDP-glucose 4-epimerase [Bacillus cereus B5-2]MDA1600361.1 UDP-glucose 4-epimerase GalE [Bacillus cereus]PFW86650.1 UDP-glucose 4-epimerase GalE [Bacillus sp. AFS075960]RFB42084.1 UDP-glucose 4-epimerase GalE [Bacillus sp. dmp10]RFB70368.1 UDP-glucose 4-epimerase GalE [Bacillus sp. AW]HDR8171858.1 UDP-glucose 4-epimerase GalE [Bacillus thuringiensis]
MAILITGGAGYIGSHTCIELLNNNYKIIVVDNLSNSSIESLNRVKEITGKQFEFYKESVLNREKMNEIFLKNNIEAVIHFAGFKAVGESTTIPLTYYYNNIISTIVLCDVMQKHNVKKFIFSSSATVYGIPKTSPITEEFPLSVTNPYGQTKLMIEQIMRDVAKADDEWSVALLRYFNPFGAHKSGRIGEDPNGIPNNLMPYVTQVAVGKLKELNIFGNDYPTKDGTGVRDYIHVVDLAKGHVKALEKVLETKGIEAYNLGTGKGYSVLEMVKAFEKVSGEKIPYKVIGRRPGDVAICFADVSKAKRELGWEAEYGLEEMCVDSWRWQVNNKNGYQMI